MNSGYGVSSVAPRHLIQIAEQNRFDSNRESRDSFIDNWLEVLGTEGSELPCGAITLVIVDPGRNPEGGKSAGGQQGGGQQGGQQGGQEREGSQGAGQKGGEETRR